MKIIEQKAEIVLTSNIETLLKSIERCGRVCYQSGDNASGDSYKAFIRMLVKNGHESVLEHGAVTVQFVCDRGIANEITRHRIASFSQESTRYCDYSRSESKPGGEITVIKPVTLTGGSNAYKTWRMSCEAIERAYLAMIEQGCTPQEARAVLPLSLKTELVMTANFRAWRHFFNMRHNSKCHPQMVALVGPLLEKFKVFYPDVFYDF